MAQYTLDWERYRKLAASVGAEGCVLVENQRETLPLRKQEKCAVFGRIQNYYYKSGTGSGGMVNTGYVISILDALCAREDIVVDRELMQCYKDWEKEHPIDKGQGWAQEPWCQEEMPLDEAMVAACAEKNTAAVVIIGRTAGEDKDNEAKEGSYYLTKAEEAMLEVVCKYFERTAVVLNVGNIIDMEWIDRYHPGAVLYAWQGGMEGAVGTARVLVGEENPSGKLPDTIAHAVSDYPSDANFSEGDELVYEEDIYVGYRYFETAARKQVRYPFGYGLSYTKFSMSSSMEEKKDEIIITTEVTNTGACAGKEVVQVYVCCPQGRLGKPTRQLIAFEKTKLLAPQEAETIVMTIPKKTYASYDDSGATGRLSCWVLEAGIYAFYVGANVRKAKPIGFCAQETTRKLEVCSQRMAPTKEFTRLRAVHGTEGEIFFTREPVPCRKEILPKKEVTCLPYTGDQGWKLADVYEKKVDLDTFIAQISDEDLCAIVKGEGMSSPRVTPGTAAAFGGVSDGLTALGIPAGCCTDGPSGMRLDSGTHAFSLPNGTLLAATFNKKLVEDLFEMEGLEMRNNHIDSLLGPGINIHRHPLNGRNFEYFSEDPYLTGQMAAAQLKGMAKAGVTGTIKHFCANNRELHRHDVNSVVSERALREIYLKGYEIAVKEGGAYSIMSTYGAVNGIWTAGNYDQNTAILREEWGFEGVVMTDWWAKINTEGQPADTKQLAAMVASQNDLYMVTREASTNEDDLKAALAEGRLSRAELARCAANILKVLMRSPVMERTMGTDPGVTLVNVPEDQNITAAFDLEYYPVEGETRISLEGIPHEKGDSYMFGIRVKDTFGTLRIGLTGSSESGELAQMSVTVYVDNAIFSTYSFQGSYGKDVTLVRENGSFGYNNCIKLYFAQSGFTPKYMTIEKIPMNL